ncbi:MAG: PAS domain-containing protein, partial [Rubrivivax sp.]|nr:PAS domain-containing protein [Rubrivivax sp.]
MPEAALPPVLADATSAAMLARLWATPFPVTLLDGEWRVVDANPAFLDLAALAREQVLGRQWLTPAQTEDAGLAGRLHKARLVDASGQERHCNVSLQTLPADDGSVLWLALWQDQTAEQRARSVAQAAQEQLLQWLDLAGAAVIIFDDAGAVLQHNREFERLAGLAPTRIDKLDEPLQALLGWHSGALRADLRGATASLEATATLALPAGARRPLAARLRASAGAAGGWQVMAVIEDRSAEEERDLARLEIEMLMDTASVGVATYDPSRGWLLPAPSSADGSARRSTAAAGLEGISRELVETESLPEYERLQAALRQRERAEVRYAVRHPELGQRWLLTRVQPGTLAEGRPTTSVVTMDVTDQERAQRRNEQLLRELTTILDGSTAGIAYLRGNVLVRCNRRFERMLGLADGSAAGAAL